MLTRIHRRSWLTAVSAIGALLAAGACSSDNNSTTSTGTIQLALTPTAATLQAGSSTTVTGVITRGGGFTGTVNITGSTSASGISAVVDSQPGGFNTGTVTLTASASATPGVDTITVIASGNGVTQSSAIFVLTVVAANGQSFGFEPNTASVALGAGASGVDTLALTRTGFAGDVTFTAENLPTGVTVTFTQPGNGTIGVANVSVGSTVAAGTYTVLLRGTGAGVSDVAVPLTIVVNGTGTGGSFTMSSSVTSLSVAPNGNNTATVSVVRGTGYTGAITFTDTLFGPGGATAPAGLTATVNPNPIPSGSTTAVVTVSATSAVPIGTYTLALHGSGAGITNGDQTLVLQVPVSAATGGSVHLDYSSCAQSSKPVFVAYQDGSGAWTSVTGTGDVYTFSIASAKGGLTVITPNGIGYTTSVQYMTQAELMVQTGGCGTTPSGKDVTGTYAGTTAGDQVSVALGGATAFSIAVGATGSYSLNNVANGDQDLVGYDHSVASPITGDKIIVRRDQNLANGAVIPVLDFSAAEAVTPASATITVSGAGAGDQLNTQTSYLTGPACNDASLLTGQIVSGPAMFTAVGLPSGSQDATDFSQVAVTDVGVNTTQETVVDFHTLANRTIVLAPAITGVTVTPVSGATYKRLQATYTLPAAYTAADFSYTDGTGNTVSILATPGFLAGSAVTLTTPDLTTATGFNATWEPVTSASVTYVVGGVSNISATTCSEGQTFSFATTKGTA